MTDLTRLQADLTARAAAATDLAELEALRVEALGKTGSVSISEITNADLREFIRLAEKVAEEPRTTEESA